MHNPFNRRQILTQGAALMGTAASGLLLPLAFFPGWLRTILEFLPFQAVASIPLQIYIGKLSGAAIGQAFLIQIAWLIGLYVLGRWFWKRASPVTISWVTEYR